MDTKRRSDQEVVWHSKRRYCFEYTGTIDADYRGEIGVILINLSSEDFVVEDGERIAQMVISAHEQAEWEEVKTLSHSDRGEGGFGHTGV